MVPSVAAVARRLSLLLAISLIPTDTARAERGQWTPLFNLGGEAIHMALVPDPDPANPDRHSRLIWWQNQSIGNVLRWPRPVGENCLSFPSLPPLGWSPGANIFCGGHAQLGDGRLLSVGGTEKTRQWGITDARTYEPTSGVWSEQEAMEQARWYPTATVLRDGRVLVTAGNKGEQFWMFGGRRDGAGPSSPSGDQVHRFGRVSKLAATAPDGYWDPSITPLADGLLRPASRLGHTVALLLDPFPSDPQNPTRAQFFFGGRDGGGNPVERDVWVLRRETGGAYDGDYTYQWRLLTVQGVLPEARSEHTAVARNSTEMFIFGGLRKVGGVDTPTNELWRLYRDAEPPNAWHWEQIDVQNPPSARWGHAAVVQPTTANHGDRMLVFGGAETPGANGTLAESRVWAFDFEDRAWSEVLTRDDLFRDRPLPRRDHAMICDARTGSVVLYGGHVGSTAIPDTLWMLDTENPPAPEPASWLGLATTGTPPGLRAGHSAAYDDQGLPFAERRLYIFGGDIAPSDPPEPANRTVYMVQPFGSPRIWHASREAPFSLSGHTADLDPYGLMHARTAETYDPASDTWTQNPATSWLQFYYPPTFIVPGNASGGGRVVAVGQSQQARYLDIPASGSAGSWQDMGTAGGGISGFEAPTAVMYEPGRILIAGGTAGGLVVGTSRTLDARVVTNNWQDTGSQVAMAPRLEHNLVLLPTGEVLAVGGVSETSLGSSAAVHCPQLWSPATQNWTPIGDLACDVFGGLPVVRNYHSTAILLPDARVISAGGFAPNDKRDSARIFCPPYLFKPNASPAEFAPRPMITSAPTTLTWGQRFTICTPNPGAVDKVCLIRAPSTTHSFDQNQRYVLLEKAGTASDPPRLFVTAPAGRDDAPPGDYLMFLVGSSDGSGTYPEAPSIAEWVRLEAPDGSDLCDVVPPGTITLEPDVIGSTSVLLSWVATADDALLSPSGKAKRFDLRKSPFPIASEYAWSYAGPVPSIPGPGPVGTPHSLLVGDLFPCTAYHFANRAEDDKPNLGALAPDLQITTTCGGGGGGEFAAREVTGEEGTAGANAQSVATTSSWHRGQASSTSASVSPLSRTLVAETRRAGTGTWQVALRHATEADGLSAALLAVTVEPEIAGGTRDTVGQFTPAESENLLGLCALRERGRVAFPGFLGLEQVLARFRNRAQDYVLTAAEHSRLGELGADFVANGGPADLLAGDVLDLTYEPAGESVEGTPNWYVLARRQGTAPPTPFMQRPEMGESIPERIALHAGEPNPSGSPTTIRFDLPGEGPVRLEVFDLLGRRVAVVAEGILPAGRHARVWDLRDVNGAPVRPGVYTCRVVAGPLMAQRKLGVLQ